MATDNHGLNDPPKGATDWHIPLNENWRDLDTKVEVRALDSNRTTFTPASGAKFVATDTGNVYLGDGTGWNRLGQISEPGETDRLTFTGAVSVTEQEVLTREVHTASGQQFHVDADAGGRLTIGTGGYLHITA